jgi:hypothetical protein
VERKPAEGYLLEMSKSGSSRVTKKMLDEEKRLNGMVWVLSMLLQAD